jgi:membrane protein
VNGARFLRDPLWLFRAIADFFRDWLERFVGVQGVDRAMAIAAQAYSAFLPLTIVYASLLPRAENQSFADVLCREFELTGPTAASVRQAFAPASDVESSITVLSIVLLLISTLSFTRGMQRLYEGTFSLKTLGMRNTPRALLWLAFVAFAVTLRPVVTAPLHGGLRVAVTLAIAVAIWLVTPYLLLGRRVNWLRLLPGATLTAIGMAAVGVWAVIWMPRTIASSAAQFGIIGVGFSILTWFVALAFALVIATTGGAAIADRVARLQTATGGSADSPRRGDWAGSGGSADRMTPR